MALPSMCLPHQEKNSCLAENGFPHIAFFPGLMIVITVLAFNFLGDGLRDAFDPRNRD